RQNRLECCDVGSDLTLTPVWRVDSPTAETTFHALAFHPEGTRVAGVETRTSAKSGETTYSIILREAGNGAVLADCGAVADYLATRTAFPPCGSRLLSWDRTQVSLWDVSTGTLAGQVPQPGRAHFQALAVHPDGRSFVTVARDGVARLWDLDT